MKKQIKKTSPPNLSAKERGKMDFFQAADWEKIFTYLDSASANLLALKKELFTIYQSAMQTNFSVKRQRARMVEGYFDGIYLQAGKRRFPVPENYASKSKLVFGDRLKLTIQKDGNFVFKVIKPVARKKLIGKLQEASGRYYVQVKKRLYEVLRAAVAFYQIKPGDYVTVSVPQKGESNFAAIENVIQN